MLDAYYAGGRRVVIDGVPCRVCNDPSDDVVRGMCKDRMGRPIFRQTLIAKPLSKYW